MEYFGQRWKVPGVSRYLGLPRIASDEFNWRTGRTGPSLTGRYQQTKIAFFFLRLCKDLLRAGNTKLPEQELFFAELLDGVAEFGGSFELKFAGGFAHIRFELRDEGIDIGL